MSSSRRPEPAGARRRGVAGWSLRTRLLAAMLALLAVVCGIVALATTATLERYLIGQLDQQLLAAADRPPPGGKGPHGRPGPSGGGPDFLYALGQGEGTLGVRMVHGEVYQDGVIEKGSVEDVPAEDLALLTTLPADSQPHTCDLGGLGEYRVLATETGEGEVMVTGLPLAGVRQTARQLVVIITVVAGAGLVAAGFAGAWIVRRTLRPLAWVAATATRVSELPLDRGEVALAERVPEVDTDPRTEVGQVGSAFNRMLGHVAAALAARQASESRVRQFVADASHELRTPLAAIRGYSELVRRMGDDVPPDAAHAMRRVEAQASRMTALVDDLLLLARIDSGRPLAREPVDLSRLVVDEVSDAHVAGPGHRWRLELPAEAVTVTGDAVRLHQVLANLVSNARAHTPPGTTVTVALHAPTADDPYARLSVADDGPGIPPALLPSVFERFARADTSRSRAAGSTGLGLAIVAAVVAAHQGRVEVASQPGRTVFTVRLPASIDVRETTEATY